MDNAKFWWSSSAAPSNNGDPGDPIGQSLRFRGNEFLTRTFGTPTSTTTQTHSWWMKIGAIQSSGRQFGLYIQSPSDAGFIYLPNNNPNSQAFIWEFAGGKVNTLAEYRDPSAWYNVVVSVDTTNATPGDRIRMFVNGERIDQFQTSNTFNPNLNTNCAVLGPVQHWLGQDGSNNFFTGYIADYYAIDGQALEPTAFGRFNANGVWVPREIDFDGNWGANGFHLTFEDPNNLGEDSSPNGNDFTATGFDTAPVGIFSNDLFTQPGNKDTPDWNTTEKKFAAPGGAAPRGFDGSDSTEAGTLYSTQEGGNNRSWIIWRPSTPIVARSSVVVWTRFNGRIWINQNDTGLADTGGAIGLPGTGVDVSSALTFPVTINNLAVRGGSSEGRFTKIIIDGQTLVDNTGTDYDLMQDSPTQNWATMNPLVTYEGQIGEFGGNRSTGQRGAADGNLTLNGLSAPGGGQKYGISTHAARGRVYLELTIGTEINGGQGIALFVGDQPRQYETYYGDPNVYTFMDNGDVSRGNGSQNGTTVLASYGSMTSGDVASIALDMDNGNAWFAVNGVWQEGDPEAGTDPTLTNLNIDQDYAFLGINCGSTPDNPNINYGQQQPFIYTPPTGFEALQTQNLPAAPIADGRDHFQAITGPGQGADSGVAGQRGGNWSNFLTAPNGFFGPGIDSAGLGPATAAFNAQLNNAAATVGSGDLMTWASNDGIEFTTSFEILAGRGDNDLWTVTIGGTTTNGTCNNGKTGNWTTIATGSGIVTQFTVQTPASAATTLYAVRVDGEILVDLNILAQAQSTFPNGLWWIKDMVNSNQHQLVDSVRGGNLALPLPPGNAETAYTAPAGDSVAWCWNVNGDAAANGDGSIASQVAANTTAGFSIVTYTGNGGGNAATIGHGLGAIPEFMLVKRTDATAQWSVYHVSIGNQRRLILNEPDAQANPDSIYWDNTTPTTQVFSVGSVSNPNPAAPFVAYCWAPIPGYSAFGSFDGNSSTDGPFIYLGFRPAFFMWKKATGTGNWEMRDTTRHTINPDEFTIYANRDFSEAGPDSLQRIDILSNGVKIRNGQSNMNQGTLIYIAFAENPFQAPVTAR